MSTPNHKHRFVGKYWSTPQSGEQAEPKSRHTMNAAALHKKALPKASDVAVTSIARCPRAIIVVLGWMGATLDEVSNYTALYQALQCSTISTTAPIMAAALNDGATLGDWAVAVGREAARLVRMAQMSEMGAGQVPILIHIMGSGGMRLVDELERCLRQIVSKDVAILQRSVPCPTPSAVSPMHKLSSTSTRSLFTNATEPLSDEDDDESSDACEPNSSGDSSTQSSPTEDNLFRKQPTISTSNLSESRLRRRVRQSPLVNRVDMARNGLNLNHSCNPDDRACQRDLELFASHMSMMLWDMGPRREMGWILSIFTQFVLFCAYGWRALLEWLFGGSVASQDIMRAQFGGLSLTRKHAIVYSNDESFHAGQLITKASGMDMDIMRCNLQGGGRYFKRKRYAVMEYVAFVTRVVDYITECQTGHDENEGWSSEEELQLGE